METLQEQMTSSLVIFYLGISETSTVCALIWLSIHMLHEVMAINAAIYWKAFASFCLS